MRIAFAHAKGVHELQNVSHTQSACLPCRFFTYWGTLVALQMQSSSLFRLIGSTIRSTVTGTSVAVVCVLLNILGSGFVLLRSQMGWWWRWVTCAAPALLCVC